MTFVFTSWYFVIFALIAGIVACAVIFIKMDKKDREIIKNYVEQNQSQESSVEHNVEEKSEEKRND